MRPISRRPRRSRCSDQTSGNCIRNISSDQFAGAAADEIADPRPWAELLRQWSSFHPEFSYLPRKFKIAVIAAPEDRAAMRLHDIGIELVERDGALGARIFVGGGMGRTPMIAPEINDFVAADDLMSYLEACLRVYNRYGRRDNIYKARIKILIHELGADEYRRQVEKSSRESRSSASIRPRPNSRASRAMFARAAFEAGAAATSTAAIDFAVWLDQNVKPHKQPGYASSHQPQAGRHPGDASADQIDLMATSPNATASTSCASHAQNTSSCRTSVGRSLHAVAGSTKPARRSQSRPDQRHHRAPASIIAAWPMPVRSRSHKRSRRASPISVASANWVN